MPLSSHLFLPHLLLPSLLYAHNFYLLFKLDALLFRRPLHHLRLRLPLPPTPPFFLDDILPPPLPVDPHPLKVDVPLSSPNLLPPLTSDSSSPKARPVLL